MTQDPQNRRRHPWHGLQAKVIVDFLIPDETFTPHTFKGVAEDISLMGMRVRATEIPKERYMDFLRERPYARVRIILPHLEQPLFLRGRIVWAKYIRPQGLEPAHCQVGLCFNPFTDEARADFEEALRPIVGEVGEPGD